LQKRSLMSLKYLNWKSVLKMIKYV